jgi:Na+-driven multidrug efflux pump
MFTVGYSFAVAQLVGKHVSGQFPNIHKARYYSKLGFGAILMWAVIIQLILEIFKMDIIVAFTNAKEVQDIISSVFYLVCTFIFLEVMQGAPMGIIRGLGIQ